MRIRGFLERHGWLCAIAFAYLYVFPYFPKIRSANELPRVYLTQAIADQHTFAIDRGVQKWGPTADVSPSHGHHYSNKAPGSSMLAAPAYLAVRLVAGAPRLGTAVWICRVVAGILPMLGFLWLLYGFLERYAPAPAVRQIVLVAYGLGSLAMTYSVLFYSHQLGAICVASAWILALDVVDAKRGPRAMIVAGMLAGAAALVDYQAVFAAVPVAAHVLVRLRRRPRRELGRAVVMAVAGALVPITILLAYHAACFGSPWRTGYDASETFAVYHQQGFLGITELRWAAFFGSTVRPDNGLVFLAPWLVFAIPGAVVLARQPDSDKGVVAVGAAVVVIYFLFISSINFWRGGWQVGPRYITAMLPFVLPPIAALVQHWTSRATAGDRVARILLGVIGGAIVVGVAVYALSTATFPYWPDSLAHPLYEVTFRLLGDGLVAPSLGSAAGVPGVWGIAPYLLVVAGVLGYTLHRVGGWRVLVVAAVLGTATLAAYGALRHGGANADRAYRFVRASVIDV